MDVQYHEFEIDDKEHGPYTKSEALVKWLMQPQVLKEWYDTANGHRLAFNATVDLGDGVEYNVTDNKPPFDVKCDTGNIKDDTYVRWAPVEFDAFSKCYVTFCCDYPKLFFDGEYEPEIAMPDDGHDADFFEWHEWEFMYGKPGPHFTMELWLDSYDGEWVEEWKGPDAKKWYDKKYPFWSSTINVSDLRQAKMFCYGMLRPDGSMYEKYHCEEVGGLVKTPMLKKAKYHWYLVRRYAFLVWPNALYWQREAAKPGSVGVLKSWAEDPFFGSA